MPTRTAASVLLIALAGLALPATVTGARTVKPVRFRASLDASVSTSFTYTVHETRAECTFDESADAALTLSIRSARPSTVTAVMSARAVRLRGTLRSLTARLRPTAGTTDVRLVACPWTGSGPPPPRPPPSIPGPTTCEPVIPPPVGGLSTTFAARGGIVSLAPVAHPWAASRPRSCRLDGDPDVELAGIEVATGRFSPARLRDARAARVVVHGSYFQSAPLPAPYTGTVGHRVSWTLTLARVTRP